MEGVGERGDAAGWLQRPVTTEVRAAWLAARLRYLGVTDEDSEQQAEEEMSGSLSTSLVGAADAPFPGDGSEASLFPPSLSLSSQLRQAAVDESSTGKARRRGEEGEAGGAEDIGGGRLR
uniref:Uncharacterized protein n=1 Tax=Oryza barthii TaxID=65489 RepID=A0A0D3FX79_9ORYZ